MVRGSGLEGFCKIRIPELAHFPSNGLFSRAASETPVLVQARA